MGRLRAWATEMAPLSNRWAAVALLLWLALTALIAARHEPWRDEADPWLVARDADPVMFLRRASLSGTPALWHLLLVPLARGGAPYESQKVLHLAIAAASAAMLLFLAPLPRLMKLAAAFSYFFAYEYAIIVRSYALSVLLLLGIAAWHRTRFDRPLRYAVLVAILANTNTHSLFIAAFLGLMYVHDIHHRRVELRWSPLLVMLGGGVASVVQLGCAWRDRSVGFVEIQPMAPLQALGNAFLPRLAGATPLAGLIILVAATLWLRHERALVVFLWSSLGALALVFTFWWYGGVRHAGLILILLVVAIWIHLDAGGRPDTLLFGCLTAALLVSDVTALGIGQLDYRFAYSGAQEIAAEIHALHLDHETLAAHLPTSTSAVAPYLDRPLWYPGIEDYGTFLIWDRQYDRAMDVSFPEAIRRARSKHHLLLLLSRPIPNMKAQGVELVATNHRPIFEREDETFWLYRFRK